jgi:hypothetical protein
MAGINIIDGFNVNASSPVDYRIVASNSTDRDAIFYKYDGLKVFQLTDRRTYTYNSISATWSTDIVGTGNTLAMFGASGSSLINSVVSQSVSGVNSTLTVSGVNTTLMSTGTVSIIGSAGLFNLVSLFPLVITYTRGGNVRLIGGSAFNASYSGHAYVCGGGPSGNVYIGYDGASFIGKIGIKTSTFDAGIDYQIAPTTAFNSFVRFKQYTETTANAYFYNSTTSLTSSAYIRSTNNYSTHLVPDYTWYNNDQVGIFHPAANTMGFSIAGATAAVINANRQIEINRSTVALPSLAISGDLNTGITQLTSDGGDTLALVVGGATKIKLHTFELSATIHNTSGATGSNLNPAIGSGTYIPVVSSTANIDATSVGAFQWSRVGNVVTVSGQVDITPTATSTTTSLLLSLPVGSAMASFGRLAGCATSIDAFTTAPTNIAAAVYAETSKARVKFSSTTTTMWSWFVHYTYCVVDESLLF